MTSVRTHLGKGGRLVLPAKYRQALKLEPGDEVVLVLEGNELRLVPPTQAVKRAQELVRRFIPKGRHLVKELMQDRRREARRESPRRARAGKGS